VAILVLPAILAGIALLLFLPTVQEPLFLILFTTLTAALIAVWYWSWRQNGYDWFAPLPVICYGFALYGLSVPTSMLFDIPLVDFRYMPGHIGAAAIKTLFLYNISFLTLLVGYFVGTRQKMVRRSSASPTDWNYHRLIIASAILVGSGLLLFGIFLYRIGGVSFYLSLPYDEAMGLHYGLGYLVAGWVLLQLGLVLLFHLAVHLRSYRFKVAFLGLTVPYAVFAILSGRRILLVTLGFGCVVGYHYLVRRIRFRSLLLVAVPFFLMLIFVRVSRFYPGVDLGGKLSLAYEAVSTADPTHLSPANLEFGSAFFLTQDIIDHVDSKGDYWNGRSYVQGILNVIPSFIYEGRPMALDEWYVSSFYRFMWYSGGSFGFSPLAEGYINFGWVGPIPFFFVLGLGMGSFWAFFKSLPSISPPLVFLYSISIWFGIFFHRVTMEWLFKSAFIITILPAILAVLWAGRNLRGASRVPVAKPVRSVVGADKGTLAIARGKR